jgi:hypothetical protein
VEGGEAGDGEVGDEVATDGKSIRGAAADGGTRPHLLSAVTHDNPKCPFTCVTNAEGSLM